MNSVCVYTKKSIVYVELFSHLLNADLPIKYYLQCFAFIVSRMCRSPIACFHQLCTIIVGITWTSCENRCVCAWFSLVFGSGKCRTNNFMLNHNNKNRWPESIAHCLWELGFRYAYMLSFYSDLGWKCKPTENNKIERGQNIWSKKRKNKRILNAVRRIELHTVRMYSRITGTHKPEQQLAQFGTNVCTCGLHLFRFFIIGQTYFIVDEESTVTWMKQTKNEETRNPRSFNGNWFFEVSFNVLLLVLCMSSLNIYTKIHLQKSLFPKLFQWFQ